MASATTEADCRPCHAAQVASHLGSNHAQTLQRFDESAFFRSLPDGPIAEARGGFLLSYEAGSVTATRGADRAGARMMWAFGAGDQGITPVAFDGTRWIEHRISYYTKARRFDLTLGHRPGVSSPATAALGIVQPDATIRACFGCHATATERLADVRPGVGCDRCHDGAADHQARGTPMRPLAKLAARAQLEKCGECHRLRPPNGADDPLNIRFQPLRLAMSSCFTKGNLGCIGCHPAHRNTRRDDAAFYRAQCVACHPAQSAKKGDCTSCHMPKSSPAPYLTFTDHFIRAPGRGRR